MKRHVRMPHSGKIRELLRLQRKTKRTAKEVARHERLFVWLINRGEHCAQAAQDIVNGHKRSYRLLSPRALHFWLASSLKALPVVKVNFAQAIGRTKRGFAEDLLKYFQPFKSRSNYADAIATGRYAMGEPHVEVFNEGETTPITSAMRPLLQVNF